MLQILILLGADLESLMIRIGMGKMFFLPTITLIAHPNTTSVACPLKDISIPQGLTQETLHPQHTLKLSLLQNNLGLISRAPVNLIELNPRLHRTTDFKRQLPNVTFCKCFSTRHRLWIGCHTFSNNDDLTFFLLSHDAGILLLAIHH